MNARDVAFWHVASFRCDAMIRRLSEAKRTLASSRTKGSIEARSSFFDIGFRNVFGGGAKSTFAFCKSAPRGVSHFVQSKKVLPPGGPPLRTRFLNAQLAPAPHVSTRPTD